VQFDTYDYSPPKAGVHTVAGDKDFGVISDLELELALRHAKEKNVLKSRGQISDFQTWYAETVSSLGSRQFPTDLGRMLDMRFYLILFSIREITDQYSVRYSDLSDFLKTLMSDLVKEINKLTGVYSEFIEQTVEKNNKRVEKILEAHKDEILMMEIQKMKVNKEMTAQLNLNTALQLKLRKFATKISQDSYYQKHLKHSLSKAEELAKVTMKENVRILELLAGTEDAILVGRNRQETKDRGLTDMFTEIKQMQRMYGRTKEGAESYYWKMGLEGTEVEYKPAKSIKKNSMEEKSNF
jgi:hypothetical protein